LGEALSRTPPIDPKGIPCGDERITVPENDIFSFVLILYELVIGSPPFPKSMTQQDVAGILVLGNLGSDIPDSVLPKTKGLNRDCLITGYLEQLPFGEVFDRLEKMRFKLTPRVNSSKITAFVKETEE
jgi:hypothetical protein